MATTDRVFQLSGSCNDYPWGKKGKDSLAARLCANTPGTDFSIKDDQYYSEMWFGDYPDYPAKSLETGQPLGDILKANQKMLLGEKVVKEMDAQLPFLPKILSIAKALPLQLHPNKELAEQLHKDNPDQFTDPNHKPEIAVALSEFELFAGWKPLSIISVLLNIPILRQFIPAGASAEWNNTTLREVVRGLLKAPDDVVREVEEHVAKMQKDDLHKLGQQGYILDLLPRLQEQYGKMDAGSLVALLCMNYMVLQPGEALFIPADGIHAYLSGDIVECMARSNNVLNSGFCPRADRNNIDLFADTLTFKAQGRDGLLLPGKKSEVGTKGRTLVYSPPISEFDMLRVDVEAGQAEEIRGNNGPSVAIVTKGEGTLAADGREFELKEGYIFFVAPGAETKWKAKKSLQVFMPTVQV